MGEYRTQDKGVIREEFLDGLGFLDGGLNGRDDRLRRE